VASPRGEIAWSALVSSQRWHAAFHLRQLELFLELEGLPRASTLSLESLAGLDLPAEVW
jgi:hypothetical protein